MGDEDKKRHGKAERSLRVARKHVGELCCTLRGSGRQNLEALEEQSRSCDYMSLRMLQCAQDDVVHSARKTNEMLDGVEHGLERLMGCIYR